MSIKNRDNQQIEDAKTILDLLEKMPPETRRTVCLMLSAFIDGMEAQKRMQFPASNSTVEIARQLGITIRRVQQMRQEAVDRLRKGGGTP